MPRSPAAGAERDEAPGEARVGVGYDSHRFDPARPLILGGVHFPDAPGLRGHSDGDAVGHALIDALLGAAGKGDVGALFPPGEARWRGADSMDLLARCVRRLKPVWTLRNVDATVICEMPRIGPRAQEMRARLSSVLEIPRGRVSVKGKTNEGMGWIGRGEGIAVIAVASIFRRGSA